jgi:hypothetical protein
MTLTQLDMSVKRQSDTICQEFLKHEQNIQDDVLYSPNFLTIRLLYISQQFNITSKCT